LIAPVSGKTEVGAIAPPSLKNLLEPPRRQEKNFQGSHLGVLEVLTGYRNELQKFLNLLVIDAKPQTFLDFTFPGLSWRPWRLGGSI
jgi:hypothetical protein